MLPTTLHSLEEESIPVFITQETRQLAQNFANQQPDVNKATQVYNNTLAVCVVNNYLRILGIQTDLRNCDSWNPMMRMTLNTADLHLIGYGRLECRSISQEELNQEQPVCYIPTEVHEDRIGYVVIHLQSNENEATIIGFIPTVDTEKLNLNQLQPCSNLLEHLDHISLSELITETITHLSQWFQGTVQENWRRLDALLGVPAVELQWRKSPDASSSSQQPSLSRGKLLSQRLFDGEPIALVLDITLISNSEFEITINLCTTGAPTGAEQSTLDEQSQALPLDLQMKLLDGSGTVVMDAKSKADHCVMKLSFQAQLGDRFELQLQLDDTILTEHFIV